MQKIWMLKYIVLIDILLLEYKMPKKSKYHILNPVHNAIHTLKKLLILIYIFGSPLHLGNDLFAIKVLEPICRWKSIIEMLFHLI